MSTTTDQFKKLYRMPLNTGNAEIYEVKGDTDNYPFIILRQNTDDDDPAFCFCPDSLYRHPGYCKHIYRAKWADLGVYESQWESLADPKPIEKP